MKMKGAEVYDTKIEITVALYNPLFPYWKPCIVYKVYICTIIKGIKNIFFTFSK